MYWNNALKRCFFHTRWQIRKQILSHQAYQDATNYVFEKRKDYWFRNYTVLRVSINYNGIIRNDIEANIQVYRVVRVIPQTTKFIFIKIDIIHLNINGSKLTFRK